jgi:hypothetical protein
MNYELADATVRLSQFIIRKIFSYLCIGKIKQNEKPFKHHRVTVSQRKLSVNEQKLSVNEQKLFVNEQKLSVNEQKLSVNEQKLSRYTPKPSGCPKKIIFV